jgi:hypothetical protein
MTQFARYIGIDYSGAVTPAPRLPCRRHRRLGTASASSEPTPILDAALKLSNIEQPAFHGTVDNASISLPQGWMRVNPLTRSEWAWCHRWEDATLRFNLRRI